MLQFLYRFADSSGQYIFDRSFAATGRFNQGFCPVRIDLLWGVINSHGEIVVQPGFELISDFENGWAPFRKGTLWGCIDRSGKEVLAPSFDQIVAIKTVLIVAKRGNHFILLDRSGKEILSDLDELWAWSQGRAVAGKNGRCGLIDEYGEWVLEPRFGRIYPFREDMAAFDDEGGSGYINLQGQIVIPAKFGATYDFSEGLARVQKNGKFGYINKSGTIMIPIEWDDASQRGLFAPSNDEIPLDDPTLLKEGRVVVARAISDSLTLYGYLNSQGKVVHECNLLKGHAFCEGLALVTSQDHERYFIDLNGKKAFEPELTPATPYKNGWACAEREQVFGFIDREGKVVMKPIFLGPARIDGEVAIGKLSGSSFGIVAKNGQILHEGLASLPRFDEGFTALRTLNPEWEAQQNQAPVDPQLEKKLLKLENDLEAALEEDRAAVLKDFPKLAAAAPEEGYLQISLMSEDWYLYAYSMVKGKEPDFTIQFTSKALKNIRKWARKRDSISEPKNRMSHNRLTEHYRNTETAILKWLAKLWREQIGASLKSPAFLCDEDDTIIINLKSGKSAVPEDLRNLI